MKFLTKNKSILKNKTFVFFISTFFIFLLPRIIYLGYDTYGFDSYFWDQRSDRFIETLSKGEFEKTYRSYHPGVTTMYLAGSAKAVFQNALKTLFNKDIRLVEGVVQARWFYINHFVSLLPIVTVISLILTAIAVQFRKLKIPTLYIMFFAILLSIEPFFLGISKFLHVTALETVLVFAFFMYMYFVTQNIKNKKLWIMSGIILGLGVLTKISAIIVLPFGFAILFIPLLKNIKNQKFLWDTKYRILIFSIIIAATCLTIFILWPALWVNFSGTFLKIYKDGIKGDAFNATPAPTLTQNRWLFYPEILLMRTTALTFVSYVFSIFFILKEKNKTLKNIVLINFSFVVYYFFIMSLPDKKLDRYVNNVFPSVMICSAYSFYAIFSFLQKQKIRIYSGIFLGVITFYYLVNLYVYFPSFSAIHSEFFGGLSGYSKLAKVKNRGEYYINAVRFINNKDGIHADKILLIPTGGKDKSARGFPGRIFTDDKEIPKGGRANYYLPEYNDLQEVPKDRDCKLIQTFGPRWPLKFDYLYLFECEE